MREAQPRIREIGAHVVAVAEREARAAQRLVDQGMPFALLLDPDNQVRQVIGAADRLRMRRVLHPKSAWAYLRSWRRLLLLRTPWSQATHRPAVAVLDAQLNVTWTHVGQQVGDYPDLEVVLTELRRAV